MADASSAHAKEHSYLWYFNVHVASITSVAVFDEALHEGGDGAVALASLELDRVDALVQGLGQVHCSNEANQSDNKRAAIWPSVRPSSSG